MHRRDLLQHIGSAVGVTALAGLSPERLSALGHSIHGRAAAQPSRRRLLVLDEHQDHTVTTIAELIIPETDTPGARAARVNEFVDLMLAEWVGEEERTEFLEGLADVDVRSVAAYGTAFVDATADQQVSVLTELDNEATARDHFFARMKWLTLYGYYTSEIGQTKEVQAMIIPGRYDPCGPVHRDASGAW